MRARMKLLLGWAALIGGIALCVWVGKMRVYPPVEVRVTDPTIQWAEFPKGE
jgi:hypothetical protein